KPILLSYGEKAALALCAAASIALIGLGLLGAQRAGKEEWADKIKREADKLDVLIRNAAPPPKDEEKIKQLDPKLYDWTQFVSYFAPGPFIHLTEQADTKRRNPVIL